jgi:hypothetical protein
MSVFKMPPLATTMLVLLFGVTSALAAWAQVRPPPIIVPQVTPRFNDPGPQVKLPNTGSQTQQRPPGSGARIVSGHHSGIKHRDISRTHSNIRPRDRGTSPRDASAGQRQPTASGVPQEQPAQAATDKRLKELDDALDEKIKSICRGC